MGVSLVTGALFFWGSNLIAEKVFSKPHLSFYLGLVAFFIVFKSMMLLNTQAVRSLSLIRVFAFMLILPHVFNLIPLILLGILWSNKEVPVYTLLVSFAITGIIGWIFMECSFKKKMQLDDQINFMSTHEIFSISFLRIFL